MTEIAYGLDLSCDQDIDPLMTEADGFLALAQALVRRLDTPSGSLIDDERGTYGEDVHAMLSRGMTEDELAAVPGRIRAQFLDDDRVRDAEVTVQFSSAATLRLECRVYGLDSAGSFTVAIDRVSSLLLTYQEAA